jgi:hypothetical protein
MSHPEDIDWNTRRVCKVCGAGFYTSRNGGLMSFFQCTLSSSFLHRDHVELSNDDKIKIRHQANMEFVPSGIKEIIETQFSKSIQAGEHLK